MTRIIQCMLLFSLLCAGCSQGDVATTDQPKSNDNSGYPDVAVTESQPDEVAEASDAAAEDTGSALSTSPDAPTTDKPKAKPDEVAEAPQEQPKQKSVPELMQQVQTQAQSGNLAGMIGTLQQILDQAPNNPQALGMLAMAAQQEGMRLAQADRMSGNYLLLKSADSLRKLREIGPLPPQLEPLWPTAVYNEACCYSLQGKKEEALASLRSALEAGFTETNLLATDTDLDNLRELDAFKEMVANADKIAMEAKVAATKESLASFKSFPFDFELPDLNDTPVSLASMKGKVVIVDIWGTWCPPCREEIPHFIELHKKYNDQGLEIVGVNYERVAEDQVKSTITEFIEKQGVPYTCVIGDEATQKKIPEFGAFPTTLFIDRDGKVRMKLVGYTDYAKLEAIVQTLLAEGA